ncbi:unnamed protein product [Rhizoctonia solani]|uniref:Metal resistance protein YCF1 n=1 Tax=Rhizoctonia solani TaxID=456999 RepID=A0A8H3CJK9_9AGAM|nr:unnamed protein product [Rhizoctonia solani]
MLAETEVETMLYSDTRFLPPIWSTSIQVPALASQLIPPVSFANRLCSDPEGAGPISQSRNFDFTPCFEKITETGTLIIFCLFAGVRCTQLWRRDARISTKAGKQLLRIKLAIGVYPLIILSCIGLALEFRVQHLKIHTLLLDKVLSFLAFSILGILSTFNHTRTRRSSTILLAFWPFYFLHQIISLRTLILLGFSHDVKFGMRCALMGTSLLSWSLECMCPDRSKQDPAAEPEEKELPYERANVYSRLTFSWMSPLMELGYKRFITEKDVHALSPEDAAHALSDKLQSQWTKQLGSSNPSLWKALFRAYGGPYAIAAMTRIFRDILAFTEPQLLRYLLIFIARYQARKTESAFLGWIIVAAMFLVSVAQTTANHQFYHICLVTGMRVRAGLVTAIYNKALLQAPDSQGARGDIVNLMSVDATRIQNLCMGALVSISAPFQIALAFVSLYELLGWPAFVGVAIMIISLPLNTYIARILKNMQRAQMKNRDTRTRLMSELLNNIRSIKLYAWEDTFIRRILALRNDQELKMLRKIGITSALNNTLWAGVPVLVSFGSFATAAYTGSTPLTADIIFPCISLFNLLQMPLGMAANITGQIVESTVSIGRIHNFLLSEELQSDARDVDETEVSEGETVLEICGGDFKWSKQTIRPTLENVDITVRKGELVGIIGSVGSGKTSLLSAIIGEMARVEGSVKIRGKIAYAPQDAWIMNATIRDNILFSHRYHEEFYDIVIGACALRADLAQFTDGDLTQVGEKGITLSGGQRARISLARAVYSRADLYLLDDPLAAVDAHVARHIFDKVIGPNGLLAGKARLHVTNSVAYLDQHDLIMMVRRGIILETGTFDEILEDPSKELAKLISTHKPGGGGGTSRTQSGTATPDVPQGDSAAWSQATLACSGTLVSSASKYAKDKTLSIVQRRPSVLLPRELVRSQIGHKTEPKAEYREQGGVKIEVYRRYFHAASLIGIILYLVCMIAQQGFTIFSNITLRMWGNQNQGARDNTKVGHYLFLYGTLGLVSAMCAFFSSTLLWVYCTIKSARNLHDAMLFAVIRSPLSFFEQTPMGRIMNLFSRDQYVIDEVLVRVLNSFFWALLTILGAIVVVGGTFPIFMIGLIPLGYIYRFIMIYYLETSRELKRLDAVTKSPIFSWFQESLGGLSTIRAFGQQRVFIAHNESKLDSNQMIYLPAVSATRWVAIRIELLGSVVVVSAAMLSLVALITTGVDVGLVGLVLSYSLLTIQHLNFFIRTASDVEQNLVSVERVLNYVNLPSEGLLEIPDALLPESWPQRGGIEFRSYCMRYRPELPPVLKDLNIKIRPGEKLGVVGRTGAGKSSFFLGLLRILEPASGTIRIDEVDITQIGLRDLRRAISIVPQEPQLFEGTIRENVDPTSEYDDGRIWEVLEQAHLRDVINNLPGALDAAVKEGGLSLSSGQRQLICFARALLRNTKILILDEATSAMDLETDKAIQEIIRGPAFEGVTTLTIAHRLNTIVESDRILVLEGGQVAELDKPSNLLQNKASLFYALALEAGIQPAEH